MLKVLHFTSILNFIKINPSQGLNVSSFSFGLILKKEVEKRSINNLNDYKNNRTLKETLEKTAGIFSCSLT